MGSNCQENPGEEVGTVFVLGRGERPQIAVKWVVECTKRVVSEDQSAKRQKLGRGNL